MQTSRDQMSVSLLTKGHWWTPRSVSSSLFTIPRCTGSRCACKLHVPLYTIYRIRQRWAIVVELESFGHDGAATKHRRGQRVSKACNSSSSDCRMATPSGMTGSCMHVSACRCIPGGQSQPQACLQPWRCPASSSAQSPGSPHCSWRSPPFGKLVHCCSHTGRLA